jgi:hypothetical protein
MSCTVSCLQQSSLTAFLVCIQIFMEMNEMLDHTDGGRQLTIIIIVSQKSEKGTGYICVDSVSPFHHPATRLMQYNDSITRFVLHIEP